MKKRIFFSFAVFLFLYTIPAGAQSFFSAAGDSIRDNQETCLPIVVNGIPAIADSSYGICTVCFTINHGSIGNLDIRLVAPDGDTLLLINNQGGTGTAYQATCLSNSGIAPIANGSAPYSNTYIPENSLNFFNNGRNPNGTWQLCVKDELPTAQGYITYAALLFCGPPPSDSLAAGPCGLINGTSCYCPDGSQDCDLLPDMTAAADLIAQEHTEYPGLITLSNATPNIGWGPMEVHSSGLCYCDSVQVPCSTSLCPNGNPPNEKLIQRVYHKNGANITWFDTLTPGTMSYHPSHGHIHINNWASFTLRTPTANPDATTWPIVSQGSKVSFCLVNLGDCTANQGYCRDTAGNVLAMSDIPNAPFGIVSGCGLDQGIYTGMLDIYSQILPDMNIDLSTVCNGNYYLVSITNPDNNFLESDITNNWAAVPVTLILQSSPITGGFNASISGSTVLVSNNNTDVIRFIWDFGDGNIDTISNPASHTYASTGTYTITLTQQNPCGTYTSVQVLTVNGISESDDFTEKTLNVSPNPTAHQQEISYLLPSGGSALLTVSNMAGEIVFMQQHENVSSGWQTTNLDFEQLGLSAGCYFIRLVSPERVAVVRALYLK